MIANTRYEGHPPGWYTLLWPVSKLTHSVAAIQVTQWIISAAIVFMILFASPFPLSTRILLPFGYYFLFEYAILSRNYAPGVLLALCICLIMHKHFRYHALVYYLLLFLLSNIHLLALLLAISLHGYFLLLNIGQKKKTGTVIAHIIFGGLVMLPAAYFIFPPSDSQLNLHFWMSKWTSQQFITFGQAPLRCFIPLPSWWNYHFWNTEFLLDAKEKYGLLKLINPLIVLTLLLASFFILIPDKKSLALFGVNLLLSFIVAVVFFPMGCARYAGFIYIGFITAWWLYCDETPVDNIRRNLVNVLLTVQVIAGLFAVARDIRLPFSNAYHSDELLKEVPKDKSTVTDYWTLNALSAFTDRSYYCIDLQEKRSFLLWNSDMAKKIGNPLRYTDGLHAFFQQQGINTACLISIHPSEELFQTDSLLSRSFRFTLLDKREGAIEKGGNLYLYEVITR